jgi:hypothetical protein
MPKGGHGKEDGREDGREDGQEDGREDGQEDGREDGQKDGKKDGKGVPKPCIRECAGAHPLKPAARRCGAPPAAAGNLPCSARGAVGWSPPASIA